MCRQKLDCCQERLLKLEKEATDGGAACRASVNEATSAIAAGRALEASLWVWFNHI